VEELMQVMAGDRTQATVDRTGEIVVRTGAMVALTRINLGE